MAGGLQWRRHYGKTRFTNQYELDGVNVVLTTYHTVSAEWKNGREVESSILFSVRWKRIILDEGQSPFHQGERWKSIKDRQHIDVHSSLHPEWKLQDGPCHLCA